MREIENTSLIRKLSGCFFIFSLMANVFITFTLMWLFGFYAELLCDDEKRNSTSLEAETCDCICEHSALSLERRDIFFICSLLVMILIFWIYCYIYQTERFRKSCDMTLYGIEGRYFGKTWVKRMIYLNVHRYSLMNELLSEVEDLINQTNCDIYLIISGPHESLLLGQIPNDIFHTNMKDFMFGISRSELNIESRSLCPALRFEALSMLIRDVLEAMKFLHEQHIYHLDLQPKNILILSDATRSSRVKAKVSGLTLAKRADDKRISLFNVGLEEVMRPPGCFVKGRSSLSYVDGSQFDCWSIGITAYELFTGGMLTVEFSRHPDRKNVRDLAEIAKVMSEYYFVSSMDSRWDMKSYLSSRKEVPNDFSDLLCRRFYTFGSNYFHFVKGLLQFEPWLRSTLKSAFESDLMKANSRCAVDGVIINV